MNMYLIIMEENYGDIDDDGYICNVHYVIKNLFISEHPSSRLEYWWLSYFFQWNGMIMISSN